MDRLGRSALASGLGRRRSRRLGPLGPLGGALLLAVTASGCWLQAGYSPGRGGHNDLEAGLTTATVDGLTESWSVDLGDDPGREPLVLDGVVFVRTPGALTALDLATGDPRWSRSGLDGDAVPAVVEGLLRLPIGGETCSLVSLDPADGDVVGTTPIGDPGVLPVPAITGSCLVTDALRLGTQVAVSVAGQQRTGPLPRCPGGLAANAEGIALVDFGPSGQQGLSADYLTGGCLTPEPLPPPPEPATATQNIVVRPSSTDGALTGHDARCVGLCTPLWTFELGAPFVAPGVYAGDTRLALPHPDGVMPLVQNPGMPYVDSTVDLGAPLAHPVSGFAGRFYAATTDGRLQQVGGEEWSATLTAPAGARPSSAADVVYVGSEDGTVAAFAAFGCGIGVPTCDPLWSASVGAPVAAPPVVSDGTLLVTTADGSLTAFTL